MSRDNDLRDCSRPFLLAALDALVRSVADGKDGLLPRIGEVLVLIPAAPDYTVDHRDQDCRR